ncbi:MULTISPECIES: type I-E CRISPR-associated protein Cas5/CasD [Roseomonadaceae]|uniref:Type I-E CRISPR-associated protein Cas5/CasD n=1 Tax=Falsiroseomonas oleicola TaxID=2801474 RepID=A0ABS6HD69_9PROT|nr:type I-E CRISPR-associated protein Cas5/CasD [Roseomonas oleicola]MBU8546676.1 type I-E CRISPR-associated protein Cas5/CasD [Roseomonas oleicola]
MPHYLTFALVAPLASFGAIAVGERRSGWDRPGRSAVLGLVGACLGLEREDDAAQAALAEDYALALLCHAPGRLLADYHTAQVPSAQRGRRFATRAAELATKDLNTILSRRDYRSDAWHLGALWPRGAVPRWSLEELAAAMQRPSFVPYMGRKSCPLGLPLAPAIAEAADAPTALAARHEAGAETAFRDRWLNTRPGAPKDPLIVTLDSADAVDIAADDPRRLRTELRRDQPRSRRRWQFDLREELVLQLAAP